MPRGALFPNIKQAEPCQTPGDLSDALPRSASGLQIATLYFVQLPDKKEIAEFVQRVAKELRDDEQIVQLPSVFAKM